MPEPMFEQAAPIKAAEVRDAAIHVRPLCARTVLQLKSCLADSERSARPEIALAGRKLPSVVGATLSGHLHLLCLGPADWLIYSSEQTPFSLPDGFEADCSQNGIAIINVTDGLAGLRVHGPVAPDVLSKSCGLDFHPRYFPVGRCARTRFACIPVIIECTDELPGFELTVARSYFHYLSRWLSDSIADRSDPIHSSATALRA